ncbi:hypothetical protein WJX81_002423 [Elliptochloris bilobata]|uniref:Uncharacterized protein n=1 Tax=Elliptochloris bilobata TaxID=381761 RepID=A0AAW1RCH9_9CHLO
MEQELSEVAWQRLRPVYLAARSRPGADFSLQETCSGSAVVLPRPAPRERSPALEARCTELRRRLEQQQYDALVHDITQPERDAAAASEGGLVTFRQQLGFGVHVLVMMGTFYALGHYAAAHVSRNAGYHAAGGLAGLVFAMLMEVVLLIIRTTVPEAAATNGAKKDQ